MPECLQLEEDIVKENDTEDFCESPKSKRNRELLIKIRKGESGAEEALVIENGGLVKSAAIRFCDRGYELDDLTQIGTIGLIKAARSFDLERGTAFSTYAFPLIIGEIRRYLRDDGMIKVSRESKRLGAMLMRFRSEILRDEGREAHISELASLCGVSAEEAAAALDSISPVASLSDEAFGEDSATLGEILPDEESMNEGEKLCDRVALAQSINKLPSLWRKIVLLRFYRDMTQSKVAEALGLSQVKISREEKKILKFLREQLI